VLDRCDQLVQGLEMAAMATAVSARIGRPRPIALLVVGLDSPPTADAGHSRIAEHRSA
jgi:hypothetical protein